jgi:hypothetical protein
MNIILAIKDYYKLYKDFDLESDLRFEYTLRNIYSFFISIIN